MDDEPGSPTLHGSAPGSGTGSTVVVRAVPRAEADAFVAVDEWAFAVDYSESDATPYQDLLEWDRTFAAYVPQSTEMAGIYASFAFELTVPGADTPGTTVGCSGLTWVGVHPEHRRRGLLRAMIGHHLADVARRGDPVSALFAAEPAIYGRFGYGLASRSVSLTIGRGAGLRDVPGADDVRVTLEAADADRHDDLVHACREVARTRRPGEMTRGTTGLRRFLFLDERHHRRGAERLRIAVARDAATDEVRGYALFRRKSDWGDGGPNGAVRIRELVALDAAAARALWGRLTDLDLMGKLTTDERSLDDPLLSQLVDVRATTPRLTDNLWVRLVDVPAALAARRYAHDVDVVLEVTDALLPANTGRWHLTGGRAKAFCEKTTRDADVTLEVRELGAVYLGGTTLAELGAAGLVTATSDDVLASASAAFVSPVAPLCSFMF